MARSVGSYADRVIEDDGGDDSRIAAAFVSGDAAALRDAYERWSPLVFRLALRTLDSRQDAEDVIQAVFIAAWTGRAGFDPERGALGAWIVGIARHRILDAVDARIRATRAHSALTDLLRTHGPDDPDALSKRAMIDEELSRLGEDQRRTIELAYFTGLSHSQIADELDIPLGTVKSHIRRGIAQMRIDWEVEDGTR